MTIVLAYLTSLLIGWLICLALLARSRQRDPWLTCFLSLGLGLGATSQLIFYTFVVGNGYRPTFILCIHVAILLILVYINRGKLSNLMRGLLTARPLRIQNSLPAHWPDFVFFVLLLLAYHMIYILSHNARFGEWDAIAFWNLKAKFLMSGGDWTGVFRLHLFTNTDYPLLLPLINVWVGTLQKQYLHVIPQVTAVLFTVSCGGLLYAALRLLIPRSVALLAGAVLLFLPPFIKWGIAQYADVVLAFYLLAAMTTLVITLREQDSGYAVVTGVLLGFLCFTKNEGLLMSVLLFISCCHKKNIRLLSFLLLGWFATLLPSIMIKFYSIHPNRHLFLNRVTGELGFFHWSGFKQIMLAFFAHTSDHHHAPLWILFFLMLLLCPKRYLLAETKALFVFFILYALSLVIVYLATINFELSWLLETTMARILFALLPGLLFFNCYAYWRKDDAPLKDYR